MKTSGIWSYPFSNLTVNLGKQCQLEFIVLRSLPRCQSPVCISGLCSSLVSLAVSAVLTSVGHKPTYFAKEIGKLS